MERFDSIVSLVLRALALAMGVATVVLSLLGQLGAETGLTLLGIGLFALALDALQSRETEPEARAGRREV